MNILETPIDYLRGVGPLKADLLKKELKIFTYQDLLSHYPFRYIDKSKFYKVKDLKAENNYVQIRGEIIKLEEKGNKRTKLS